MKSQIIYVRFGDSSPTIGLGPQMLTTAAPPLIPFGDGADLDYVPFFLFDKVILDKASFEYIRHELDHPNLLRVRESILALHDEGYIDSAVSFRDALVSEESCLAQADDDCLREYESWVPLVQKAAKDWKALSKELENSLRTSLSLPDKCSYPIAHYLTANNQPIIEQEVKRLEHLLLDFKPTTRNKEAQAIQSYAVKCYLSNVHAVLCLSRKLGASWYDWGNVTALYERKAVQQVQRLQGEIDLRAARTFFEKGFPAFRPRGARELIRLLKHRHLQDLRKKISAVAAGEEKIDEEYEKRALAALAEAQNKVDRIVDVTGYATTFLPIPLLDKAVEKVVETVAERRYLKAHNYLYFTGMLRK